MQMLKYSVEEFIRINAYVWGQVGNHSKFGIMNDCTQLHDNDIKVARLLIAMNIIHYCVSS